MLTRNPPPSSSEQSQKRTQVTLHSKTVLNDPKKRENYDKYGTADLDLDGMAFEEFMNDFGAFEDFLEEVLAVLSSLSSLTLLKPCFKK